MILNFKKISWGEIINIIKVILKINILNCYGISFLSNVFWIRLNGLLKYLLN